jgi:hypothetical protein
MIDYSNPSTVTGLRRAAFELCVGISAARAQSEIAEAMLSHAMRSLVGRMLLDMGSVSGGSEFHTGGIVGNA